MTKKKNKGRELVSTNVILKKHVTNLYVSLITQRLQNMNINSTLPTYYEQINTGILQNNKSLFKNVISDKCSTL